MVQKKDNIEKHTLTHEIVEEVVKAPFRLRSYHFVRKILIGFILVSLANLIFTHLFYTPKMYKILDEKRELALKYHILQDKINTAQRKIGDIKHRDNYIYRPLFARDSFSLAGVYSSYPQSKYEEFAQSSYAPLMDKAWRNVDALARMVYLESRSFDELQKLAQSKELMSASIPAIWPIDRSRFKGRTIGAFGMRFHPVDHYYKMHYGIDLGGSTGDPVFATGDGVVSDTRVQFIGYGRHIDIDHEFGYKTRYAHLSKILVERGDTVKRGQLIGLMGNSGKSTSTHLHYEVMYRNNRVNPVNYIDRDISDEEYQTLMEQMQITTYED